MLSFLLRRLLWIVPVLLGISVAVFGMLKAIPGDPALQILGAYATPERIAALTRELGGDLPLPAQYLRWLEAVAHGDLGHSYARERPVLLLLREHLGPTALLAAASLGFGSALGLTLGAVAARHQGGTLDRVLSTLALVGISTPSFWLAMLLMLALAVWLPVFPVSGLGDGVGPASAREALHHLVLPAIPLALVIAGVLARTFRATMVEVLRADYLDTARALGVAEPVVVYRHAFKVALAAVVPVVGLQAGYALGGAVYIETVFQWPGLGRLLVEAIGMRDLMLVQGIVLVLASGYVLVNLAADLVQRWLDPRVLS
ncbi:MAG: ABC transporter permease [Polyangiales bacterium]